MSPFIDRRPIQTGSWATTIFNQATFMIKAVYLEFVVMKLVVRLKTTGVSVSWRLW